nr:hypothetical protein [Ectothiorhodospira marina]
MAAEDPGAAVRMDGLFSDAANWLATHPKMGKTGRIPGTCTDTARKVSPRV